MWSFDNIGTNINSFFSFFQFYTGSTLKKQNLSSLRIELTVFSLISIMCCVSKLCFFIPVRAYFFIKWKHTQTKNRQSLHVFIMRTHTGIPCVMLHRVNWHRHCNECAIKYKIFIFIFFIVMLASLSKKQKVTSRVKRRNPEQTVILTVKYCCETCFKEGSLESYALLNEPLKCCFMSSQLRKACFLDLLWLPFSTLLKNLTAHMQHPLFAFSTHHTYSPYILSSYFCIP